MNLVYESLDLVQFTIINLGNKGRNRVISRIYLKQNGCCRFCQQKIEKTDVVVSAGHNNKKYYHRVCAERLNII